MPTSKYSVQTNGAMELPIVWHGTQVPSMANVDWREKQPQEELGFVAETFTDIKDFDAHYFD